MYPQRIDVIIMLAIKETTADVQICLTGTCSTALAG